MRWFDTAPLYGAGRAERLLAPVLSTAPRQAFVLSTKVGRLVRGVEAPAPRGGDPFAETVFDFSESGTRRSLRESQDRLGVDRIDVVLIHDPDDHHEQALAECYPTLAELRDAGSIGAIGVGMNRSEPLARFAREASFDCLLVAGRYTLLDQSALDDLLPVAAELGVSIIAGGVYNSGVLAGPNRRASFDYRPASDDVLSRARELAAVCRSFEVPLRAAALAFPSAHPVVATVLVGARSPSEVDDALDMWAREVPVGLWAALKERGLLREDAPTPGASLPR